MNQLDQEVTLKPFGTRLDEDLIVQVKVISAKTSMSVQDIVDKALRTWIAEHPA